MSTIKDAMDTVALRCAITVPNSWVASNTRTYTELKSILASTIDELLEQVDWPDPIRQDFSVVGTGASSYALPDDFKRLVMEKGAVIDDQTFKRCTAVGKRSVWTFLAENGVAGDVRYYRVTGDEEDGYQIEFQPALAAGDTATVAYVSKNWLTNSAGQGLDWTAETDTLLLPRRAVELGCIWRFRQQKGMPFEDNISEYEAYLSKKDVENLSGRAAP